jgi:rhodanese-related sulfurtransferase
MKKKIYPLSILFFIVFLLGTSCANDKPKKNLVQEPKKEIQENQALIQFLEQSGNFINSHRIPTLIPVEEVYANLKKYFVIDLRSHSAYVNGHIDGAVNVALADLVSYMKKNVAAGTYDKIIMVCYSGQKASFAAMTLQLLGYSNAYAMKWGMSSWDKNTAQTKWLKKSSDKYASKLETKDNPKASKTTLPDIKTGKTIGYDILEERAKSVLKEGKFLLSVDELMKNPSDYYIVNYWPEYNYKKGHLPGAVQYTPKQSLSRNADLLSLPKNKKIAVYCYTGQHAAFVVAYLQILGYDAYSISYGANSFMHSKLSSMKIGHGFTASQIKNYPLVQGELPSIKKEGAVQDVEEEQAPVPVIKKKKVVEEEGGC